MNELGFSRRKERTQILFTNTVLLFDQRPMFFRESKDLQANQTGSHTNAVGRKMPTDAKNVKTKLLNQGAGKGKRGSAEKCQTKLLNQGNYAPKYFFPEKTDARVE